MQTHSHITLSQLQRLVKEALHERFALPVWVSAEISEIKVNYSGHCYLELVEKGGDNGVPLAQSRAVIWRTAYPRIAGYFEAETGQRLRAEHLSALLPEAVRNFLARQATRLDNAAELIAGRSPERILRLGFAVVRTGGKAVVSARDVRKGDALEIEVADGTIHGTVQRSEPK